MLYALLLGLNDLDTLSLECSFVCHQQGHRGFLQTSEQILKPQTHYLQCWIPYSQYIHFRPLPEERGRFVIHSGREKSKQFN